MNRTNYFNKNRIVYISYAYTQQMFTQYIIYYTHNTLYIIYIIQYIIYQIDEQDLIIPSRLINCFLTSWIMAPLNMLQKNLNSLWK